MRQEIENPMLREPAERLSLSTQEVIAGYHKDVRMTDRVREMWKDTTRRMEAGK